MPLKRTDAPRHLLAVSTAEQGASLALFSGGLLAGESFWSSEKTHSKRLLAMIEHLVEGQAGLSLSDLDGIVAARGPGSFTGLRIGIGVVKGLACGAALPVAGVSSLDGIGFRFSHSGLPVCVMMDARRREVYTAVYHFEKGTLVSKTSELVCPPDTAVAGVQGPGLFVGSGARVYREQILSATGGTASFGPQYMEGVSAAALAGQALDDPSFFQRPENRLLPVYLRKSDAELHAEKTDR